ncbi:MULTISPECIES: potassium channel family protein [Winogradskyella]|uniref:potassium channel family protein n=1 Tax=Winogradskyella TaxID=286104 RepID=UPI0015CED4BD|nr:MULTISPECIES: potassium channel protein [Winogradskyella]QXP79716.1 potassium channel protein [Winogradskyella sp. HaHa_3_26]
MNNTLLKLYRSKIYTAVMLVIILLTIGVLGYRYIAGYFWLDALYMTVITVTTVGFAEVNPLDTPSKIFTIFLILTSIIVLGYAISIITEYILNRNNYEDIKQRKMQKKIEEMSEHIIICGYGRNGKQAAKKLLSYEKSFVIIEENKEVIEKCQNHDLPFVLGNANDDEILIEAGIKKATTLISALPNDADNLFVVLSARQINAKLNIISRASEETSYSKLKLAGANNVILPDRIGGDHMASLVVTPDLIEFIDNLSIVGERNVNMVEVKVEQLYNAQEEKTIKDLDLRNRTGCTVIGFKNNNGDYIVNPEADTRLVPGSHIIVLGRPEQIMRLNSEFELE